MKDTDFERISESASLLTNRGYFDRFRELQPELGVKGAWARLESELPLGLRRYTHYHAFEAAKKKEAEGCLPEQIIFKFKD